MDLVNRYIKVTRDNEMEVLKALEELGFTWSDGFKPTQWSTFNMSTEDVHFIQTIGEREINFCSSEIFLDAYIKNKEFNLEYLKSLCGNEKLEQSKVIRNLKDLDGLENGNGLKVYWCETDKYLEIYFKSRFVDRVFRLDKADVLIAMGFKFEYKPLRKLEEVRDEIRNLKSLPFIHGESNYIVACDTGKWYIDNLTHIDTLSTYVTKEQAQKYVDELNEIVGGK
ncbi:MAG: hypothetical protein ACRCXT_14230 [Paraclostridium sp.]